MNLKIDIYYNFLIFNDYKLIIHNFFLFAIFGIEAL